MKTKDIAAFLSADLVGDPEIEITGVASLDKATSRQLSFFQKGFDLTTLASAVITSNEFDLVTSCTLIKVQNPKLAFARIAQVLHPRTMERAWHETAVVPKGQDIQASYIGPHVSIGANASIGIDAQIHAGVRIGSNVSIGELTIIHPNCVIYDGVTIGANCVIHAGSVIGSDGFGYVKQENGEHLQFPQLGTVVVGDNVEIGANCCIDGGSLGVTNIGDGTKIDNLVHIAHNVQIGKRVLIAGQSGIAGSSVMEDDVVIAGQVGISDHVTIKAGAMIGAKSAVFPNKIVRAGFWMGIPVQPIEEYTKQTILIRNLERLKEEVDELRKLANSNG